MLYLGSLQEMSLADIFLEIQVVHCIQLLKIVKTIKITMKNNENLQFFVDNFPVETLLILITATALNMREHVGAFSGTRRNETEPSTQEELSFIDKHQQKQSDQNITILIYQNKDGTFPSIFFHQRH